MGTILTACGGQLRMLCELTRVKITCAVTLTTTTGYLLAAGRPAWDLWMPVVGVFLLASGSSALNQYQDARFDALMERTRNRPIPAGRINPSTALFVAGLLIMSGFSVLASIDGHTEAVLLLGGLALAWYNGLYTYLKRVTAFAVVPGALIGAIPPVMGYAAAGGRPTDPLILLVACFFFIWQIPHFWLLILMMGDQYGKAGLPTLTRVFSRRQLARITFMWLLASAAGGLVLPTIAHHRISLPWSLLMVVVSFWLVAKSFAILRPPEEVPQVSPFRRAFIQINVYALIMMICLSLDSL